MTNLHSLLKSRDITLPTKICIVKVMFSPVVMYGCERWTIKKAEHQRIDGFETVVLEKTLERPLDCKEIKSVNPRGNQPWIFTGRTDAEDEALILWPPDVKTWLFVKDPDAGKDWRQEEKGMTEDEMVGWHHKFGRWWGRPGVLQSIGLQRVRHDWATEQERSSRTCFSWAPGFWWQGLTDLLDYAAVLGAWGRALSWHHSETLVSSFDLEQDSS